MFALHKTTVFWYSYLKRRVWIWSSHSQVTNMLYNVNLQRFISGCVHMSTMITWLKNYDSIVLIITHLFTIITTSALIVFPIMKLHLTSTCTSSICTLESCLHAILAARSQKLWKTKVFNRIYSIEVMKVTFSFWPAQWTIELFKCERILPIALCSLYCAIV